MADVFDRLAGQDEVVAELREAARAARRRGRGEAMAGDAARMTHAWLFTGPPGSGRSIAARCLAAALECTDPFVPGCGRCRGCETAFAGAHADVTVVVPEGLTIAVKGMRELVRRASSLPQVGDWLVIVVEDADRLTEAAANALLKVVEEPPARTVIMLCTPTTDPADVMVTLRSRSRHVYVRVPRAEEVERHLVEQEGLAPDVARWAASVSGGHIGRARHLATDQGARERRSAVLGLPLAVRSPARAYAIGEALVAGAAAEAERLGAREDEKELDEMRVALGAGGTGRGAARATRGSAGFLKELERRQKTRGTRTQRDALDLALVDLVAFYRDALVRASGARVDPMHGDRLDEIGTIAGALRPEALLRCGDAVTAARTAIARNVKPRFAIDAMVAELVLASRGRVGPCGPAELRTGAAP